jgi:hypothetical protein
MRKQDFEIITCPCSHHIVRRNSPGHGGPTRPLRSSSDSLFEIILRCCLIVLHTVMMIEEQIGECLNEWYSIRQGWRYPCL